MQGKSASEVGLSVFVLFHSFDSVSLQGLKVERFSPLFTEGN